LDFRVAIVRERFSLYTIFVEENVFRIQHFSLITR